MPTHNDKTGRVGIYTRGTEAWLRTGTIDKPDLEQLRFGRAVDLGAHNVVIDAHTAAYLYARRAGQWHLVSAFGRSDPVRTLGSNVAYADGFMARSVQSFQFGSGDEPGVDLPGVVRVYRQRPHGVRLVATLHASDAAPDDRFGTSLAMDRGILVAGAPGLGAAYVFVRVGDRWVQQQKLVSSDGGAGSFGTAVAVHDRTILVGAPGVDLPGEDNTSVPEGNAYVFLQHRGTWFESQRLNDQGRFFAQFGTNAALSRDLAAVVAPIDEGRSFFRSIVVAFDRLGAELTSGRSVVNTGSEGRRVVALDASRSRIVVGTRESEQLGAGNLFGWVRVVEFADEAAARD